VSVVAGALRQTDSIRASSVVDGSDMRDSPANGMRRKGVILGKGELRAIGVWLGWGGE
jgi:hypothetical protein